MKKTKIRKACQTGIVLFPVILRLAILGLFTVASVVIIRGIVQASSPSLAGVYSPKKGVGGEVQQSDTSALGLSWWYNWQHWDYNTYNGPGLIAMGRRAGYDKAKVQNFARNNPGRYWLIGNEPTMADQDNLQDQPELAAGTYRNIMQDIRSVDPTAKFILGGFIISHEVHREFPYSAYIGRNSHQACPGTSPAQGCVDFNQNYQRAGPGYWNKFYDTIKDYLISLGDKFAGWHIHVYYRDWEKGAAYEPIIYDPDWFIDKVNEFREWQDSKIPGKELWITEFAILDAGVNNSDGSKAVRFAETIGNWLESNPKVNRYAWYKIREGTNYALYRGGTTLTGFGRVYQRLPSSPSITPPSTPTQAPTTPTVIPTVSSTPTITPTLPQPTLPLSGRINLPQGVPPIVYMMFSNPSFQPTEPAYSGALGGLLHFSWKQLEEAPGSYNWTPIYDALNNEKNITTRLRNGQVIKKPIGITILILPNVRERGIPDYIYQHITGSNDEGVWRNTFPAYPAKDGVRCTSQTCQNCLCNCTPDIRPPWEERYFRERYNALVAAFGREFNGNPDINFVLISPGLYGENVTTGAGGGCQKPATPPPSGPTHDCGWASECRFDYDAARFGNWLVQEDILGKYRQAFPTKPLIVVNSAPTARLELTQRALQLSPPIGIKYNGVDYDFPEDNCYPNDRWRVISYYWNQVDIQGLEGILGGEHAYPQSSSGTYWALLSALSRRMTFIDLSTSRSGGNPSHIDRLSIMEKEAMTIPKTRENSADYFPMWSFIEDHFGRNVTNTPSVWIVLRDTQYACGEPGDWEFFLYRPEDIPGQVLRYNVGQDRTAVVVTSQLPDVAKNSLVGRSGTSRVRRTDQASGNYYMYFKVDEKWPATNTTGFKIEITYLDKGNDSFKLEFKQGGVLQSISVRKQNTNKFIREEFSLPNFSLKEYLPSSKENFRINCLNDGDEYIHMVRVIPLNWQAPLWDFSGANTTPTPPNCPRGDLGNLNCDSNGLINGEDLNILLGKWSPFGPVPTLAPSQKTADLNSDRRVDEVDLNILLSNWGSGR